MRIQYLLMLGVALFVGAANLGSVGGGNRPDVPMPVPPAARGQAADAPRKMKENVVAYVKGDEALASARKKAQATLPRFVKLVESGAGGVYTVKFPLTQNGETEHIWMQLTGQDGRTFQGLLANDPVNGTKFRMGDRVEVAAADVDDWMVRSGDAIYGGYTVRAMLKDMPKAQADQLAPMFRD